VRVVSVNVGLPREVAWHGKVVLTSIFKEPVSGSVRVRRLNLDGDRQADLSVHGGPDKALYAYPVEHYRFWETTLERTLGYGAFGENLTLRGLPLEDEILVGDRIRIGTAELVVTQPRLPCFKLGVRFGDPAIVRRFLEAGRTGYYLRVVQEGDVAAGDDARLVGRGAGAVPVSEITRVYASARDDVKAARAILAAEDLPVDWRTWLERRLERAPSTAVRGG
jgi:MOSC domain-containing protein YiiM